jgi:hypothetical protein
MLHLHCRIHLSPNPPPRQPGPSAHSQHSASSHYSLSPLYHCSAINTPHLLWPSHSSTRSALFRGLRAQHPYLTSGLNPFRLHPQGHNSLSTGRHARESSLVMSLAMVAPYSFGSACATRHLPPASPTEFYTPLTPNKPSSPSSISPSPLALRPDEDTSALHHSVRTERSRSRRHTKRLRREHNVKLVNGNNTVDVEEEDDEGTDGKRRGRMGRDEAEVGEESPRSA